MFSSYGNWYCWFHLIHWILNRAIAVLKYAGFMLLTFRVKVTILSHNYDVHKPVIRGRSTAPSVYQSSCDGFEVCPLSKSDLQSLDFVVNRFLMKLFKTSNNDIISN